MPNTNDSMLYTESMDSLQSILLNKKPQEPPQIMALKTYVKTNHGVDIQVFAHKKHYIIQVPGASIAQKLRMENHEIIESCKLDKKLVIHIGY